MIFKILTSIACGKAEPGDPSKPAGVFQPTKRRPLKACAFPTCRFGDGALERCLDNAMVDWARIRPARPGNHTGTHLVFPDLVHRIRKQQFY